MPCPTCNHEHTACSALGFCTKALFLNVRPEEVSSAALVAAARATISEAARREGITSSGFHAWIVDKAWMNEVQIVNQNMRPVEVDLDCLEPTDEQIDTDQAEAALERLRDFFRSNFFAQTHGGQVFVTARWHHQFASVATVIGACHPEESQWWPRKIKGEFIDPRAANDNRPVTDE